MNLIDKLSIITDNNSDDPNIILFNDFRKSQYENLEYFVNLCVDYISKQHNKYLNRVETTINEEIKYEDIFGYLLDRVQVKIKDTTKPTGKKVFISFLVPRLIDNSFYYLNGSYYSPTIYILDKPISIKKNSIKIYGLFNSITIFTKDKRAIFAGHNIPINYFLQLFIDDDDVNSEFLSPFGLTYSKVQDDVLYKYFSSKFHCDPELDAIKTKINNLFLDDYTKQLYASCYNINDPNISNILLYSFNLNKQEEKPSFVDLRHKRLVFMELILRPVFKRCADIALRASNGFLTDEIQSDSEEVIKFFTTKLKNKFLYDIVNLFSGITTHKVSFMNPGSDNAPGEIAALHDTHFGIIDPVNLSAQNPGETTCIVPGIKIHKMGLFLNNDGSVI